MPLGDALDLAAHRDRERDMGMRPGRAYELDDDQQRLVRAERRPFVVDDDGRLTVGVEDEPEIRSGGPHEIAEDLDPRLEIVDGGADRRRVRVDPEHRGPDLAEHERHDHRRRT